MFLANALMLEHAMSHQHLCLRAESLGHRYSQSQGWIFQDQCQGRSSTYVFVCGVVRAVHLVLVESLRANDFVLPFRRFAALKRVPSVVYSDNGKNFVGGQRTLKYYLAPVAPKWKFICPRSPWWGGWWERLVRSVKNGIRKTLGKQCLTKT